MVAVVGLSGSYFFVVYVQHVTPGAFVAGMTLLTGLPQVIVSLVKALLFGLSAGLIACYKGLSRRRRPDGGGQRRQRDRRVRLHGAVPDQHPGDRLRREGGAMTDIEVDDSRSRWSRHTVDKAVGRTRRLGEQTAFYGQRAAVHRRRRPALSGRWCCG